MRAAAYVRVSTDQQDVSAQREAISRAAAARGDELASWFEEKESGSKRQRPVLDELRREIRGGRVRKLYVFALDRLSRAGIYETFKLLNEFRQFGCEVATLADGFELAGPGGEVVAAVMAWAAEQERRRMRERMAVARTALEAQGGTWGRRRKVDPTTLAAARNMQKAGLPLRTIASRLKVARATLHRALVGKGHYGNPISVAGRDDLPGSTNGRTAQHDSTPPGVG